MHRKNADERTFCKARTVAPLASTTKRRVWNECQHASPILSLVVLNNVPLLYS